MSDNNNTGMWAPDGGIPRPNITERPTATIYDFTTRDGRKGRILVDSNGRIEEGVMTGTVDSPESLGIPIEFLESERVFDPTIFHTITPRTQP